MAGLARGLTCASPSPRRPLRAPPPPQPPGRRAAHLCRGLPPRLRCCRPRRSGAAGRPSPPGCPWKVVCGPRRGGLAATADSTAIRVSQPGLLEIAKRGSLWVRRKFYRPIRADGKEPERSTDNTQHQPSQRQPWLARYATREGALRPAASPRDNSDGALGLGAARRGGRWRARAGSSGNGGLCSRIHMHISNLRRCCCRRRPGSRPAL